jgi:hypothetical protein
MLDASASPKHRIDASKTLDTFAGNGPEAAPASDRFIITINLGADEKLTFNKSIKPTPHDIEVIDPPQGMLAAIAASKRKDDDSGEPVLKDWIRDDRHHQPRKRRHLRRRRNYWTG